MERNYVRFFPVFLALIHGALAHAFQTDFSAARQDTALINTWYREAYRSMQNNMERSDQIINKAWKASVNIGYDRGIADGYYFAGCMYEKKGAENIAARYFENAISLYEQGRFLENLADSYRRLGVVCMRQQKYFTVLRCFVRGLGVAEDQGNYRDHIELSIQLASYHNTVSMDYKQAVALLRNAEEEAEARLYNSALGPLYLQYGIGYSKQRDYDRALHYCRMARTAFQEQSAADSLLEVLLLEAKVYCKVRNMQRLISVLKEAEPLFDSTNDPHLSRRYELLRATALYFSGDYQEALKVCKRLDAQGAWSDQHGERHQIRSLQLKALYALGRIDEADSLFDDYDYTKDSLFAAQYAGQVMEMREDHQLERLERRLDDQAVRLSDTAYQQYGLIASIAILLSILVILYLHFRTKDRLAHRMALKNAEISVQNEILKQANKHNELLLREIHHRVKNNLQIINSLLSLQARHTDNPEVASIMRESSSRINSIALIHNKLYQQQSLNKLNIQDYIEQLGAHLLSIYNIGNKHVRFNVEAEGVSLDIDTAIPVGLILTELMTNSLKYAFVDRQEGDIDVHVKSAGERQYELVFRDNGVGIPEAKLQQPNATLGLRLIHSLTKQLAGSIQYKCDAFSMYNIRFKGQI
jgi:Signal transduction histidine kinase